MTKNKMNAIRLISVTALLLHASLLFAVNPPQNDGVAARSYGVPELYINSPHQPLSKLPLLRALQLEPQLSTLGVPAAAGFYDLRSGRWGTLLLAKPLIPGNGVGNALTWASLGRGTPSGDAAFKQAVWQSFSAWLAANRLVLGVDASQLDAPSIGSYENGRLLHIYAGRVVQGIPVRATFVTAAINNGNLVLFGTQNWGAIDVSTTPEVTSDQARAVASMHLSGFTVSDWGKPELVIVPVSNGAASADNEGRGLRHRLAWSFKPQVKGSDGSWEALVDAKNRELLGFYDRNQYAEAKRVVGGVYPVSNDGASPNGIPDGVEQPQYPMSRAYVFDANGTQVEGNSEGLVNVGSPFTTRLTGPFVKINDNCGAINETSSCPTCDLGTSAGTDCATPFGKSPGNTHSARTGFYEVNRLIDQAKSWLGPASVANLWVNRQLPANMNIDNSCNAFFSPADTTSPATGSINFYRLVSASPNSGVCRNTGEIAAVFDHEWGHGLDTFDDSPGVAMPGEAYADMAAIMRLNSSCIGRGFFTSGNCGGNGDPCTQCNGVREADWKKRQSQKPHDLAWVLGQNPTVPGSCGAQVVPPTPFSAGPCGRGTHCEGSIITEAMWDLLKRDLPCQGKRWESFPGGPVAGGRCSGGQATAMSDNSALVLGTRLFYLAGGGVTMGYQCDVAVGGCVAGSWYLRILAADDDDGSLLNGTPHMVAIQDAFVRHGIGCGVPLATNFGCTATPAPSVAPVVSATAGIQSATVNWTAVPGAAAYWVLRSDGVHGCDFGKTRVAEIAANTPATFTQTGLLDGRTYYYSVVAVGGLLGSTPIGSCAGPMSQCASVTPLAPNSSSGAGGSIEGGSAPAIVNGDGDPFVDNCETADLTFTVSNGGGVPLTNVRVTSIAPSASQTQILTPLPIAVANLAAGCGAPGSTAPATFRFRAGGLASQSTLTFNVTVQTDQTSITGTLTVTETETDLTLGNVSYDFENGTDGWIVESGTFERVTLSGTGGEGTASYMKSSSFVDSACDRIRSPRLRFTPSTTLSLHNQFVTEAAVEGQLPFYDRANVAIVSAGGRAIVNPDGGRLYNATDEYTGCNTGPGWATSASQPVNLFAASSWSAAALGGANYPNQKVQVEVVNGTDESASASGLQFDQVRINNVLLSGPDQQSDVCPALTVCYEDTASQISYSNGWHTVRDNDASGGTYRVHLGNSSSHRARLTFTVGNGGSSTLEYKYATSRHGGTADVYIDGVFRERINYRGTTGEPWNPNFNGAVKSYTGLTPGTHTFELRNMRDVVILDRICVPNSNAGPAPGPAPGATASQEQSMAPGEESQWPLVVPAGTTELSVAAVTADGGPVRIILLDPLGGIVGIADGTDGVASLDTAVSASGIYLVKVINLGAVSTNVWSASTPLIE
jgi:trimeric autotransporter adhesin